MVGRGSELLRAIVAVGILAASTWLTLANRASADQVIPVFGALLGYVFGLADRSLNGGGVPRHTHHPPEGPG